MSDAFSSSLRGAVDLSSLNKPHAEKSNSSPSASIELPSLLVDITEANLRNYLSITEQVPLIIEFHDGTQRSAVLGEIIEKLDGSAVLGRINLSTNKRVAEAFSVSESGTVVAVIKGQPFPLFQGVEQAEKIQAVIDKLLEVAVSNGVAGKITVNPQVAEAIATPRLSPQHQLAVDTLNAGEYTKANEIYQQILREAPADTIAAAGLAQTELLIRVDGLDFEKVLDNSPQNFEELMVFADALIAIGDFAVGFDALLVNYPDLPKDNQEVVKERLLKYFEIVGKTDPAVVAARARLTSMLF